VSAAPQVARIDALEDIRPEAWNALVSESATNTVFQTHEWHTAWWAAYGGENRLLLLRATVGDELMGLAAFAIDASKTLRFVGHGKSDFADVICAPDRDDVRAALLRAVAESPERWHRMELRYLPADSPTVATLANLGLRVVEMDSTACPTLLIEAHSGFFADVRRKKSLRRHHNYFQKQAGYSVEHTSSAAEILPHLPTFFAQHVARWRDSDSPSLFRRDADRRFYEAVTEALDGTGWLRFTQIAVDNAPIAFHFGFVYRGVFVWYKPSFDIGLARRSPGEALLKELFDRAAEEHCREFDFTVGEESFKARFSNHRRRNLTLTVFARPVDFWFHRTVRGAKKRVVASRSGQRLYEFAKRILKR